jgi:hypothetical protein
MQLRVIDVEKSITGFGIKQVAFLEFCIEHKGIGISSSITPSNWELPSRSYILLMFKTQIGQSKSEEEGRLPASLGLAPGGSSRYAAFHLLLLASAFRANTIH